ncbi:carbohydrate-responsive element-binding protein-like [Oncorhynchus kisutch]|uniref:carbohydrate-responsive element-binding protein-like n=1 Tax=Oncorhynchus kisutch TaxID=8019 RepID=UPI00099F401D|nr:carbohydrate-responsive element-binding protein-like [Oncorhynchus kisutch]XP_031663702.1 carbohydrate-responsive element-binding protein-like [Oncorhynchus kisutch]
MRRAVIGGYARPRRYIRQQSTSVRFSRRELSCTRRLRDSEARFCSFNSAINVFQLQLPVTCQRFDHMREKFREYVRARTLQNWWFWIFSIIVEPLFESYNRMVSTASVEDLCRTTLSWLDQYCSQPALRPTHSVSSAHPRPS